MSQPDGLQIAADDLEGALDLLEDHPAYESVADALAMILERLQADAEAK